MGLSRNELKRFILGIMSREEGWITAGLLSSKLYAEKDYSASERAVRMALVRYYRQGIIARRGPRGKYEYLLSAKGKKRLEWLQAKQEQ